MATKYFQLNLAETFNECQEMLISDTHTLFSLLEENIDINVFIPLEFHYAFYKSLVRKRDYPLIGYIDSSEKLLYT